MSAPLRLRFPTITAHPCLLACVLLASALGGRAGGLSTDSPFLPAPGDIAMAGVAAGAKIQLAGIGDVNGKTWVCLYDTQKMKSHWFAVGTTTDGIQIVSCDNSRNLAVIRAGGETITLNLRKPSQIRGPAVAMAPVMPAPLPPPVAMPAIGASPGGVPVTKPAMRREDQEREARMLVSDLMEIGMRQRKAYEEAQKKAAEQKRLQGQGR